MLHLYIFNAFSTIVLDNAIFGPMLLQGYFFRTFPYTNHLFPVRMRVVIPHAQLFVGPEGCGTLPMALCYVQPTCFVGTVIVKTLMVMLPAIQNLTLWHIQRSCLHFRLANSDKR